MPADANSSPNVPDPQQRVDQLAAELDEALRREAAVAEILQVTNASGGDLALVLNAIIEKATRLCSASYGYIWTYDDESARAVAAHGDARFEEWLLQRDPVWPSQHSPLGRVLLSRRLAHVVDAKEDETYRNEPRFRDLVDRAGLRTLLHVPLLKGDTLLGVITVYRRERQAFTDQHIRLLESFAEQAVIAMENARLLDERREALERQTATAEVLQVINSSPGNLAPVFDAILEKAHSLCDAPCGSLQLYDGETFRAVADRGLPEELATLLRQGHVPRQFNPSHHEVTQVADIVEIFGETPDDPVMRAVVKTARLRTMLWVPLIREGAYLGRIVAARRDVRPFSDKQVALLQNFAAQAVIAMENARLLDEQREALEQQTATAAILQIINSSPGDLQPVFDAVLSKAMTLCDAAFGIFNTFDGQSFHTVAAQGVPGPFMQYRSSGPPDYGPGTAPGRLLGGEKWVHVVDMADSDTYRTGDPNRRALVDLGGARSTLVVPLRKEDTLLGMVAIYRQEVRPFSDRQIALVQNFADQAVIAMENARLLSELRERTDDLTESLEYQTATSEVLEVIGRSTSDIQPVLDTMLNAALRLCRTESGGIAIQQGEGFRYVATLGWDPEADKAFRSLDISAGRGTVAARVIAEGQIVQVADVASDPEFALPDMAERAQWRTALGVPLMREGRAIGVIAITRDRVDAFTERQIALVKTFADQAVIAMENARLLGELRESLDQQTATTEVLQVINSSPGELEPVFEAILEKAMQACHAAFGGLWIFDAGRYVAAALHKVPKAYADFLRSNTQVPGPGTGPYRFLRGERSVIQNIDLADEEVYPAGDPQRRALVDLGGARTALQVPLCKDDTVIGVVTIYRQEVRAFDERHITLLQSFAAQAVIAIQNARLLSELRASLEQQTATSDVLKTISRSSVDLEAVLETLVETVARLCGADQSFMIRRRDNLHHLVAAHGLSDEALEFLRAHPVAPGRGSTAGRVVSERRTIQIADVLADPEFTFREGQKIAGFRTMLGIPLIVQDNLIGVFVATRTRVDPFSDREIALATGFADQAVIAIENARLFEELRDRQAELRVTFDNMGDGVAMFDAEPRLAAWNRNFEEIIGLPEELLAERPSYANYLRMLAERGEFGTENVEAELASRLENTDRELRLERTRADGMVIEVRRNAVPGGGFVLIYSDVTEQRRAEAAIRAARDAAEAALERQTATADILKVIASSPTDVQPVLEAVAKAAVQFCGATDANIHMRDGDEVLSAAHHGPLGAGPGIRRPLNRETGFGTAILDGRTTHVPDVEDLDAVQFATTRRLAAQFGFRAFLAAPLLREGAAIGSLSLRRAAPGPFTPQQVELLETFAAQAVIAIENARLFTELRESLEQQTATSEILRAISQSPTNVEPVLKAVVGAARRFCGADDAMVVLREETEQLLATHEGSMASLVGTRFPLDRSSATGRAAIDGRTFHVPDVASLDPVEHAMTIELARRTGVRALLAAPMLREGSAIGCVLLRRPTPGVFKPRQIELLEAFAAQAVIAIENVRLFTELRNSLERLKSAQANLIQAEKMASLGQLTAGIAHEIKNPLNFVNNFAGLSSELLDELKQAVDALLAEPDEAKRAELQETMDLLTSNLAKIVEHGRRADGIVKSMLAHSRGGTGDWQPSNINALVEEALNLAYHGARAQDKDFNVTLERDFAEAKPIEVVPQDVTRVFLNLLGNGFYAAKKRQLSGAGRDYRPTVTLSTRDLGDAVEIRVRDNGTGMPPEVREKLFQPFFTTKPTGEGTGLGLSISYDIVTQQHGGSIEVESEPGSFTEFTVRLPRRRRAA